MTGTAPGAESYSEAKRAAEAAETALGRRRGELVAAVLDYPGDLPTVIENAAELYEGAEEVANAARDRCAMLRTAGASPEEQKQRHEFARISALVAMHVMGWSICGDGKAEPWRRVDEGGKRREIPNFAGDMGAVVKAEAMLLTDARIDLRKRYAYGVELAKMTGSDPWKIALAGPYARAYSLLKVFGVNPSPFVPADINHTLAR